MKLIFDQKELNYTKMVIKIFPYDKSRIHYNTYSASLSETFYRINKSNCYELGKLITGDKLDLDTNDKYILIKPNETIITHTIEFFHNQSRYNITMTPFNIKQIKIEDNEFDQGYTISLSPFTYPNIKIKNHIENQGCPGFCNKWKLKITNTSSMIVLLAVGQPIADIKNNGETYFEPMSLNEFKAARKSISLIPGYIEPKNIVWVFEPRNNNNLLCKSKPEIFLVNILSKPKCDPDPPIPIPKCDPELPLPGTSFPEDVYGKGRIKKLFSLLIKIEFLTLMKENPKPKIKRRIMILVQNFGYKIFLIARREKLIRFLHHNLVPLIENWEATSK